MSKIENIIAREIKDSRGKPTVEVEITTKDGMFVDSVPSGASTGTTEALELRDADGKGVSQAIKNVNEVIAPKLKGMDVVNQKEIDEAMLALDGTENKSKLGANAILAVSLAVCRAGAAAKKVPLYQHISEISGNKTNIPLPMFNIVNGGAHAKNELDIQEFMVIPKKKTFQESLVACNNIFNRLRENIEKSFGADHLGLGDEGGFAPPIATAEQALLLLKNAIGDEKDVVFALDCAASEFYKDGKYVMAGQEYSRAQMVDFYKNLVATYPIISIEDPFSEQDSEGFKAIKQELANVTIVGDDLTTTNIKLIQDAENKKACNGIILKVNQIGSISETIAASNLAKSFGWKTIVSHRSGETLDDFIADLAVGTGADFLKSGSPAKEERMVKYSRLLVIEKELTK